MDTLPETGSAGILPRLHKNKGPRMAEDSPKTSAPTGAVFLSYASTRIYRGRQTPRRDVDALVMFKQLAP